MRALTTLVFLLVARPVVADQLCVTASSVLSPTSYAQLVDVPKFDPALGVLNRITVEVTGHIEGEVRLESLDAQPYTVTTFFSADIGTWRPDHSGIVGTSPSQTFVDAVSAFDGVIDFAGTSGFTHVGISATSVNTTPISTVSDIVLFTGPYGSPGTIQLIATAIGNSYVTGMPSPLPAFVQSATVQIRICYDYTAVAPSYCSGDGSATACPCGNASTVGANEGCLNSLGLGGALRGAGSPSVSSDTFGLTCSQLPVNATGMFIQGTTMNAGGAGTVFGDGLRCVGGVVVRLATKTASAGVMRYPEAGDAPISVRGSVTVNSVRFYQAWYRNAAAFCTNATFNLSQGVAVIWSP